MRLLKEIRNLLGNYHAKSGIYHYYRNEYKQAIEFLLKALDTDEDLTDTDRRTARYYLTLAFMESAERHVEAGDLESAAKDYAHGAEVSPDYADLHYRLGRVFEQMERTEDGLDEYRKAINVNPRYLDAWIALGFGLLRVEKNEEAEEAFRNASEIQVDLTREPFGQGVEALRAGDREGAAERFHLAFLYIPHVFREHYRTAVSLLKAEQYEEALDRLSSAIDLNPTFPDLYNFRGIALYEMGKVEESVEEFRRAYGMNPRFGVPRINLAFALLRAGQFKEGEAALEAILNDDASDPAAAAKLEEIQSARSTENKKKRRSASRGTVR